MRGCCNWDSGCHGNLVRKSDNRRCRLISSKIWHLAKRECARAMVGLLLISPLASAQQPAPAAAPQPARGPSKGIGNKGMVVSGRAVASEAGTRMLNAGGNAADAGAATLLALSVLTVGAFCIGGEVPILYYSANPKTVKVIGGQGGAPLDPQAIEWY